MDQKQMQAEAVVREVIINEMTRIYQTPAHVRSDKAACAALISEYQRQLSSFSRGTLKTAWDEVRESHETWIWPHLKTIKDACKRHAPASVQPTGDTRASQSRDERAMAMASEFMRAFTGASLAARANAEGWWRQLERYAWDCALAQASIICGLANWGYSAAAYQFRLAETADYKSRRRAFESFCRTQAASGSIAVEAPDEAISAWSARKIRP
jgi:hypothetical protein